MRFLPQPLIPKQKETTFQFPALLLVSILGLFFASPLAAVYPMPPYSEYPCPTSTTNCAGGSAQTDLQVKVSARSARSSCE